LALEIKLRSDLLGGTVTDGHQDTGKTRRNVQVVYLREAKTFRDCHSHHVFITHLEATVNTAVQAYADCQQKHGQNTVASCVRHDSQANRRSKLPDTIENLSGYGYTTSISGDEPIGQH
jgi:porphobilinogen deaminase